MSFIKTNEVIKGDLLRTKRKAGYYHYGIAIDSENVIHFSGTNDDSVSNYKDVKIRKASLLLFLKDDSLEVMSPYDSPFSRDEVVKRAYSFLNNSEFNGHHYNLVINNCEHFARYVYYGKSQSKQVNNALSITAASLGTIVTAASIAYISNRKSRNKNDKKDD